MLHPALYKLIGLQFKAGIRRMLRGGKSPGRIIVFLLGALVCIAWLFSALAGMTHRTDPNRVRIVMPMALLAICAITAITSAGDKAIAFTPGEVDQLFPGPFTRRELIGYKLLKSTLGAGLTALVLSVVMLRHAHWWPACFAGVFMSLLFVQWFSIVILLAGQAVGEKAYSRLRKMIIGAAIVVAVVGARTWIGAGLRSGELAAAQFHASPLGRFILAPFEPFGELMTAETAAAVLKWSFLAALLNAGLLMIVFQLDGYYLATAMAASERRYAKIQRLRGGSFLALGAAKSSTWHLPQFPFLGGVGPIAWRQITSAARSSRGLLLLLLIVAIGAAPVLTFAQHDAKIVETILLVTGWLTFLCSSMLNFDFRGDIDHIETLKALPLRGWTVVLGQLVAPVLLLTCLHWLLLAIATPMVQSQRRYLLAAIVLVLPFNLLLFQAENLIFLLFPSRPATVSPGDFQMLGRKFIFVLAKLIFLALAAMIAAIPAGVLFELNGRRLPPVVALGWVLLAAQAAAVVPILTWAYNRFDPSLHTPA